MPISILQNNLFLASKGWQADWKSLIPKNKTKNPLRDSSYNELRDMLDSIDQYLLGDDDDLRSTVADLRKKTS